MANYLLVGAGFSRNWGGWLASEAFEYLLGCPEITQNTNLNQLLWRHQSQGGFESALAELQTEYYRNPQANKSALNSLQAAITRMFDDMNTALIERNIWEFQNSVDRLISTFLTRFDAIFSLNQDLLLEHYYTNSNISLIGKKKWAGAQLPGMQRVPSQDAMSASSWAMSKWYPESIESFKLHANCQPIFKLHGSSNWFHEDGHSMLIMGGAKAQEIGQTPILKWYADNFEEKLSQQQSQLMIIGYGFRDDHINATISRAIALGLKIFIISPEGADLARSLNKTRGRNAIVVKEPLEEMFETALIGASRRSLREIFGDDLAEYKKIMRFFDK
ncbi:SIR2-like protein [Jezberella montanilacus]|uniref:SIR2-like protein n=1 Tax=Jezberella montanilacus TaxID=323426 RepID=A0A2T0XEB8_9BURK|nr:SIR2 family protein [Jezberella montanilacus]PRY97284.1 SIR2-like protein [Jezberella montanilacus]|eukprot:gene3963-4013_t